MVKNTRATCSATSILSKELNLGWAGWLRKHRQIARFIRDPAAHFGLCVLAALLVVAAAPQLFTQWDPLAVNTQIRLLPPSRLHPFGTDEMGRDVLSRVLYGTRLSLGASGLVVLLAALVGGILGALAGYFTGITDEIIMRVSDGLIAFPTMMVGMAIALALGAGLEHAAISLAVIWWPQYARMMRGQVVQVRSREFVVAAQSIGTSGWRILFRHIVPNCLSPFLVTVTLDFGIAVLTLGGLSFIGVGAQPPLPEWGALVAGGRRILFEAWWVSTFPGLAIFVLVMATNLMGDALRDALDPHLLT